MRYKQAIQVRNQLVSEKRAKGYVIQLDPNRTTAQVTLEPCRVCGVNPVALGSQVCVRCAGQRSTFDARTLPEIARQVAEEKRLRLIREREAKSAPDPFAPARRKIVLD